MRKKYSYNIDIILDEKPTKKAAVLNLPYPHGGNLSDLLTLRNDSIVIACTRNSDININDIFRNYNSGIYAQIAKSFIYYICTKRKIPKVKKIVITSSRGGAELDKLKVNPKDFQIQYKLRSKFCSIINSKALQASLDESPKGTALLKAASHLIKSKTKEDIFDRFDSLWKAFNSLYKIIGKSEKDHDCHVALREKLLAYPTLSTNTARLLSPMTEMQIRDKLRWRQLILNDYATAKKTKALHDFILRYTDARLMKVICQILPYRQDFLTTENLLQSTLKHIQSHIQANVNNDQELTAFLCIKYMYFVRNRSAHGERLDRIIGLNNKEIKETQWLSDVLESLIIDLINSNNLF
ncbi:hypothetical protein [Pseudomonas sp. F3-2]|uniref:hypothetical protein n=1 Tax=Pseudomonas sp. F3-2 TaxID=3141539 RepID=UPI00315D967C